MNNLTDGQLFALEFFVFSTGLAIGWLFGRMYGKTECANEERAKAEKKIPAAKMPEGPTADWKAAHPGEKGHVVCKQFWPAAHSPKMGLFESTNPAKRKKSGKACAYCGLSGQDPDSLKCDDCGADL